MSSKLPSSSSLTPPNREQLQHISRQILVPNQQLQGMLSTPRSQILTCRKTKAVSMHSMETKKRPNRSIGYIDDQYNNHYDGRNGQKKTVTLNLGSNNGSYLNEGDQYRIHTARASKRNEQIIETGFYTSRKGQKPKDFQDEQLSQPAKPQYFIPSNRRNFEDNKYQKNERVDAYNKLITSRPFQYKHNSAQQKQKTRQKTQIYFNNKETLNHQKEEEKQQEERVNNKFKARIEQLKTSSPKNKSKNRQVNNIYQQYHQHLLHALLLENQLLKSQEQNIKNRNNQEYQDVLLKLMQRRKQCNQRKKDIKAIQDKMQTTQQYLQSVQQYKQNFE